MSNEPMSLAMVIAKTHNINRKYSKSSHLYLVSFVDLCKRRGFDEKWFLLKILFTFFYTNEVGRNEFIACRIDPNSILISFKSM